MPGEELLDAVRFLPLQVRDMAVAAADVDGLPDSSGIANVVILGVGAGRVAGDVVAALAELDAAAPVVATGGRCPAWISDQTLVIAVSQSGNEQATVNAARHALEAGGRLVAITSGGQLGELCGQWGVPVVPVDPEAGPSAGVGVAVVPVLVLLERLRLATGMNRIISGTATQLEVRHRSLSEDSTDITSLASVLPGRVGIVTGAGAIGKHASRRWVQELDLVGGVACVRRRIPTGATDVATGRRLADSTANGAVVIVLRHDFEPPGLDGGVALLGDAFDHVHTFRAEGDGPLAQLFDLILTADAVAAALAADRNS